MDQFNHDQDDVIKDKGRCTSRETCLSFLVISYHTFLIFLNWEMCFFSWWVLIDGTCIWVERLVSSTNSGILQVSLLTLSHRKREPWFVVTLCSISGSIEKPKWRDSWLTSVFSWAHVLLCCSDFLVYLPVCIIVQWVPSREESGRILFK